MNFTKASQLQTQDETNKVQQINKSCGINDSPISTVQTQTKASATQNIQNSKEADKKENLPHTTEDYPDLERSTTFTKTSKRNSITVLCELREIQLDFKRYQVKRKPEFIYNQYNKLFVSSRNEDSCVLNWRQTIPLNSGEETSVMDPMIRQPYTQNLVLNVLLTYSKKTGSLRGPKVNNVPLKISDNGRSQNPSILKCYMSRN
ncbi:12703_t:CDS:2 [Funneliformis mosseae]|uniref:12703_t:CDS:1 n=1 Tax=Funneliformis mosseae TaxID=27381 RepID=A0A9N9FJ01_FUNMO|nr:12703_t:CDS:2 [Funneliformis mosseae]